MNAINVKIQDAADAVERSVETVAANLGAGVGSLGEQGERLQAQVRSIGRDLVDTARTLGEQAGTQARARPWVALGIAFVAGLVAARALRR